MGLPRSGLTMPSLILLLLLVSAGLGAESASSTHNGDSPPSETSLLQSITYFFEQLEQPEIREAIVNSADRSLSWCWLGSRGSGSPIGLLLNGAADRAEWNEDDMCPEVEVEHSFHIKPRYVAVPDLTTKTKFKTPCMLVNYTHGSDDSVRPDIPVALYLPEQASLWPPIKAAYKASILRLAENQMVKIENILKNKEGAEEGATTTTTELSKPSGRNLDAGPQEVGVRELDVDADYDGGPRDPDKLTRNTEDDDDGTDHDEDDDDEDTDHDEDDDHDDDDDDDDTDHDDDDDGEQEVEGDKTSEAVETSQETKGPSEEDILEEKEDSDKEDSEDMEDTAGGVVLRMSADNTETKKTKELPDDNPVKEESLKIEKIEEEEEEDNFMSGASAVAVFLLIMLLLMAFVLLALYKRRRRMRRMVNITMPLAEHEESGVYHVRMQEEQRRDRIGSLESLPTTLGTVGNASAQEIDIDDAVARRQRKELEASAQPEASQTDSALVDIESEEGRRIIAGAGALPPIIPSISNGNLI